ncbi:peptidoglycan endopeptidase [Mesobacillus boroniphilus]|uniref:Peptidoglycan endopeptidase n=1 Tax=Mesobacillus boroniphilus TaxID=308892 RepID=A0A944CN39_9BACI|nr:peptidoglycan endopeptidase [Mesobacillus boroniphilus]MBS8265661.1 peptidoglycan endopeptidase [Mesobacillus boroniphilus]
MKKQAASFMTAALLSTAFAGIASADTYTVKRGDTLSQIAISYKTSVPELKKVNKLSSDLIYINQQLTVPSKTSEFIASPGTTKTAATPAASLKTTAQVNPALTYVVKSGDTLGKIASIHKIKLNDLMEWNGLKNHLIYPGQVLKVSNGTSTPAKKETTPDTPAQNPALPVQSAQTSAAQNEYIVQSGDTLGKIGMQFGMTVQQLKELNKLTSDLIFVGQKLFVAKPIEAAATIKSPVTQTADSPEAQVISYAKEMMGVPYVWAGSTPDGFDCSGFIYYAFNKTGKKMGRFSSEGYYNRSFYVNNPVPGDLVFFENTYKKGISHMGIYLGNNEFIHASTSGGVMISNLSEPYYAKHFEGFKRFY